MIAGLATIERRQESLRDTVASLLPQVERLFVHCNDYQPPQWLLAMPKVTATSFGDLGDAGKFVGYDGKGYFATCDDDLIYPPDYIARLLAGQARHPGSVVSFHGAVMPPGWKRYFRDRKGYACLGEVSMDVKAHVIGTGVALLPPGFDRKELIEAPRNMGDINVAVQAHRFNIPMWILAHPGDWIKHTTKIDLNDTIWATAHKNDLVHSRLLKRALSERNNRPAQKPN